MDFPSDSGESFANTRRFLPPWRYASMGVLKSCYE